MIRRAWAVKFTDGGLLRAEGLRKLAKAGSGFRLHESPRWKVALISGAARGIGGETAQLMAKAGAKLVVGDVLDDRGRQTVAPSRAPARRPSMSTLT